MQPSLRVQCAAVRCSTVCCVLNLTETYVNFHALPILTQRFRTCVPDTTNYTVCQLHWATYQESYPILCSIVPLCHTPDIQPIGALTFSEDTGRFLRVCFSGPHAVSHVPHLSRHNCVHPATVKSPTCSRHNTENTNPKCNHILVYSLFLVQPTDVINSSLLCTYCWSTLIPFTSLLIAAFITSYHPYYPLQSWILTHVLQYSTVHLVIVFVPSNIRYLCNKKLKKKTR